MVSTYNQIFEDESISPKVAGRNPNPILVKVETFRF